MSKCEWNVKLRKVCHMSNYVRFVILDRYVKLSKVSLFVNWVVFEHCEWPGKCWDSLEPHSSKPCGLTSMVTIKVFSLTWGTGFVQDLFRVIFPPPQLTGTGIPSLFSRRHGVAMVDQGDHPPSMVITLWLSWVVTLYKKVGLELFENISINNFVIKTWF